MMRVVVAKKNPKYGCHAADIHVVRPHDEAERADGYERPNHHAIAEDVLARVTADQVRHDPEGRQGYDVDLGVTEEPEQVLEQDRAASSIFQVAAHFDDETA